MYPDELREFINKLYAILHLPYHAVEGDFAKRHLDRLLEHVEKLQEHVDEWP